VLAADWRGEEIEMRRSAAVHYITIFSPPSSPLSFLAGGSDMKAHKTKKENILRYLAGNLRFDRQQTRNI